MPELLPHKAVKQKAGILKDTIDRFTEEYRWTEPGLYRGDVKESEKVSGGGVSNPTKNVAVGELHLNRRALVKSALRQLDEAQLCLNSAIGLLEQAQPKYVPTDTPVVMARAERLTPASRIREAREAKLKREERGQGWGTG